MDHDKLIELVRQHGVTRVAQAVRSIPDQLQHGWDLTTWSMQQVPGAVLFFRLRDSVVTGEPRVLCVNAPAAERATWEALAKEADAPIVLLLAPGGRVAETAEAEADEYAAAARRPQPGRYGYW